jgi:hypothetical protein
MATLKEFLNNHRVDKDAACTHTSVTGGKYYIDDFELETFYSLYATALNSGERVAITERHIDSGPVLVDLDLKTPQEDSATVEFATRLLAVLKRYVEVGDDAKVTVFRRSGSHGIHMVAADIVTAPCIQFKVREELLGDVERIFGCDKAAEVHDKAVIKSNGWLMYGSCMPKYKAGEFYKPVFEVGADGSVSDWRAPTTMWAVERFSIRNKEERFSPMTDEGARIFKEDMAAKEVPKAPASSSASSVDGEDVERLVGMLSEDRASKYKTWLDVGFALGNVYAHDTDEGLRIFKLFSAKDFDYDEGSVEKKWESQCINQTREIKLNFGSLYNWAKEDSPAEHKVYEADKKLSKKKGAVLFNDAYAAERFLEIAGDDIVFTNSGVHVFVDGVWEADDDIVNHKVYRHKDELVFWTEDGKPVDYGGKGSNIAAMLKQVRAIRALSDRDFFVRNGDTGMRKLLFADGIYDMDTREFTEGFDKNIVFRAKINRPFPRERDADMEARVRKTHFVDPFMDTPEERAAGEFLLTSFACGMAGLYHLKKFTVCVGLGNAGRGVLTEAFQHAFGGFVKTFNPNELAVRDMNGSDDASTNAFLMDIADARLAFGNEADMCKKLNGNAIKSAVSGGDVIMARKLYSNASPIVNRSTLALMMNDFPRIVPYDDAVDNRLDVVEFKKAFKRNHDPSRPWEGEIDITLRDKIKNDKWKDALFWVVADAYTAYLEGGAANPAPPVCVEAKTEWVGENQGPIGVLKEVYDITLNIEEDFVPVSRINAFIKKKLPGMSATKFNKELRRIGLKNDPNRKARVGPNGESVHVWRGIVLREGECDFV